MAYGDMARVYDRLMEDAPYDLWVDFTKKMIAAYQPGTQTILELGCGTGEITHRLHKHGFRMTGVDLSSDMLTIAQQKNPGADIQWLQQDMTALEGLDDYECITSYCDVFNYLTDENKVKAAFSNAFQVLGPSGLFMFDVHSLDHIQQELIGSTFAEVHDDLSYIWFCDPGEQENSIIHDLTFFIESDHNYYRFDEVHHQRGYGLDQLKMWLEETGFIVEQVHTDFSEFPSEVGDRWLFVCRKSS